MRLRPRLRLKKKLETDVLDLERNLEAQAKLEEQQRAKEEQELQDTNESLSYQTCTNQAIQGAKMKLESEIQTLQSDCDEMADGFCPRRRTSVS